MQPATDHDVEGASELACLQAGFPQFSIWREITWGRARFVARSLHPGTHPHTVITPDPGELRAALSAGLAEASSVDLVRQKSHTRWPA